MWPYSKSQAVADPEPHVDPTPAEKLAEARRERADAGRALNAAFRNCERYNRTNPSPPFVYQRGSDTIIQTPKSSPERSALDRELRSAFARHDEACRQVGMLENPGLVLERSNR